jgi:hypothetical protein
MFDPEIHRFLSYMFWFSQVLVGMIQLSMWDSILKEKYWLSVLFPYVNLMFIGQLTLIASDNQMKINFSTMTEPVLKF